MPDERPPDGAAGLPDLSSGGDEITSAWLDAVARSKDGPARPRRLLEVYGELARRVIDYGVQGAATDTDGGMLEPGSDPAFDRALARAAAEIRRSHLSIAQTLGDMSLLGPQILRWLRTKSGASEEALDAVRATLRVLLTLDRASRRIVRVLEASALRSRREQSETLAAMTDQLSHELKNRLGAAQTAADMLLDPSIDLDREGLRHVAQLVQVSVQASLRTVGDVRTLVASRANVEEPEPRPAPLPRLIRSVLEEVTPTALEEGVALSVEGDHVECEVDASRLRLIVFNLVGNGVKYSDPEKDERFVRVRTQPRSNGTVELQVADNGVGIAEEELEDVFLYRARGSGGDTVPGSGLGLAIAREAVDQIGGTISVESELGEGTVFTVVFEPLSWPQPHA